MDKVYAIWKSGYAVNTAMGVLLVGETEKAMKFRVLNSDREIFFHLPKKALKFDTKNEGIVKLAHWFTIDGYLRNLFDRFANHYKA